MWFFLIVGSLVSFIFALICGIAATNLLDNKVVEPPKEWIAKQLTAGAWVFGLTCIAILVTLGTVVEFGDFNAISAEIASP